MYRALTLAALTLLVHGLARAPDLRAEVVVVDGDVARVDIVVDARGAKGAGPSVLNDAADWLADSVEQATGVKIPIARPKGEPSRERPALVIARADAWPAVAAKAGLKPGYGAYCIATEEDRVFLLGNSEDAARHAVADLLRRWGFRWFAPSPRWRVSPTTNRLAIDLNLTAAPALVERRIWYAYGMSGEDLAPLMANYNRWSVANRLGVRSLMRTGHSYGNIIGRNAEEFAKHPEYYALMLDGKRDSTRAVNARKLCLSNPALIKLVAADRLRLLEAEQRANPAAFMVSVDPSDGEGTCHCDDCKKLGSTTDRVLYLANQVARHLRKKQPQAWVGLYAYSSHRLPPNVKVEPNVYVQVAMGFNRTQYTLPELIERWSKNVASIGLREYYGVEAWDWGLPGRLRGGQVDYHRKWIPYYADRNLNAINAETNANWGGQTLGLYVASQLMWNPNADVGQLSDEFFQLCFEDQAETMQGFYAKLDAAPALRSATLLPLYEQLGAAWESTDSKPVRARLVDLMAYLVYVSRFRDFDLVRSRQPTRNDAYYAALRPLMQYAWRIRHRDMVHYYALARRLCNGLPVKDKRLDYYMFNKQESPVWMQGEPPADEEVRRMFLAVIEKLKSDNDPTVAFSRLLDRVRPPGEDGGASGILSRPTKSVASFRSGLRGFLVPAGKQQIRFAITPTSREVEFRVFDPRDNVLFEKSYRQPHGDKTNTTGASSADANSANTPQSVMFELPRANEYRVEISGNFELQAPPETPFVYEASVQRPAWVSYSGPHYFYVPRGVKELIVDANPRLSLHIPGVKKRLDIHPALRKPGAQYVIVPVPAGADGKVWRTSPMTRGKFSLLNVPPLLSFHRNTILVPREISQADGLTTNDD